MPQKAQIIKELGDNTIQHYPLTDRFLDREMMKNASNNEVKMEIQKITNTIQEPHSYATPSPKKVSKSWVPQAALAQVQAKKKLIENHEQRAYKLSLIKASLQAKPKINDQS